MGRLRFVVGRFSEQVTSDQKPSTEPPAGKKSSHVWRIVKRLVVIAFAIYLIVGIILYFLQPLLIFPGAYVHRHDALVQPSADYELLELHAPGGQQIASVFGRALNADGTETADADRRPTILFLYGNGDCIATSMGVFDSIRHLGANVLIPEYIGYPLSPGTPSDRGCVETADAAYEYLLSRPNMNPRQIFIVGRSIGSGPAIDLASRKPVAGLITISAFTSLDDMAHKVAPIYPTSVVLRTHFNNAEKIAGVRCPILLVHGSTDTFVPYQMMSDLARRATAPVSLYTIDKADHNNVFEVGGGKLFARIAQFMRDVDTVPERKPPTSPGPGSP